MPASTNRNSHSWYRTTSEPPPSLREICKALGRDARHRNGIMDLAKVKQMAARVDRRNYTDASRSDHLVRFLLSEAILLPNGSKNRVLFDPQRAEVVAACCDERTKTPPAPPLERRVKELLMTAQEGSDMEDLREQPSTSAAMEDVSQEVVLQQDYAAADTQAHVEYPETSRRGVSEDAPVPTEASSPSSSPHAEKEKRIVLFLTPMEYDIWTNLNASKTDEHGHFGVPLKPEELERRWIPLKLKCDSLRYAQAVQRFIDSGLVEIVDAKGKRNGDMVLCRLTVDPEICAVVEIDRRVIYSATKELRTDIREIQRYFLSRMDEVPDSKEALVRAIHTRFEGPRDEQGEFVWSVALGIFTHEEPEEPGDRFQPVLPQGIFHQLEEVGRFCIAYPEFEAIRLCLWEDRPFLAFRVHVDPRTGEVLPNGVNPRFASYRHYEGGAELYDAEGNLMSSGEALELAERSDEDLKCLGAYLKLFASKAMGWVREAEELLAARVEEAKKRERVQRERQDLERAYAEAEAAEEAARRRREELRSRLDKLS